MERVVDFRKAVKVFGGYSGLARQLDEALSTVHGWARRKRLPPWRARQITALAEAANKNVWKAKRKAHRKKAA